MIIDNMAWLTAFDDNFDTGKYLYHYTNIDKAFKILDGNSLRFSKISRTNDTLESKLKINFETMNQKTHRRLIEWIHSFNDNYSGDLQLLCFSMDNELNENNVDSRTRYSDYSGRGFAMPRMWAQYANNNTGVCLVYDKNKLSRLIQRRLNSLLLYHSNVVYKDQLFTYKFSDETIKEIDSLLGVAPESSGFKIQCHTFIKENCDFTKYNYFHKLDDWKGEKEFRYLAYNEKNLDIDGSNDAIVGVVVGEKIDPTNERILCMLCEDLCELKKITFTIDGCRLINIHMD